MEDSNVFPFLSRKVNPRTIVVPGWSHSLGSETEQPKSFSTLSAICGAFFPDFIMMMYRLVIVLCLLSGTVDIKRRHSFSNAMMFVTKNDPYFHSFHNNICSCNTGSNHRRFLLAKNKVSYIGECSQFSKKEINFCWQVQCMLIINILYRTDV